jgi:ribosomal protein L37AE/L43A
MSANYGDPRWQRKRLVCMERDNWNCVACGESKETLHVHHKRYCGDIWDSPTEDLQTLCNGCHMGLGPHPKAGVWYEKICEINRKLLVADNWHGRTESVEKDAVAVAVQNCPQCGQHEFHAGDKILNCLSCGWSMQLFQYTFLHTPATIVNPEQQRAKHEAEDRVKKKAHAYGQLKTWARKCREHGFSDGEIWMAAFPEHAVPLGYELDSEGTLDVSLFHLDEIAQLKAYLSSGLSFHDIAWEMLGNSNDLRRRMAATGHAPEVLDGR